MASSAAVPVGFHYETKFVVLSYLGLLSQGPSRGQRLSSAPGVQQDVASQSLDQEVLLKVKTEIEDELKSLDKEISEAFPGTGFDRHTSPVFSPAHPESSVEDCLAHLGERVSRELHEPLHKALQALLSQPVTYQAYRECTLQATVHASGWDKILVPLVLLQQMLSELMRRGQEPLSALLQFGVTYLEDHSADFIIQQGGWGTVFNLESEAEEDPGVVAEDSNDIYILPSDNSGQVSPPESPTVTTSWQSESLPVSLSASQSWHTESLPVSLGPESWQQIGMDPEEVKSLDSNGAGEKSENNSSNSDIVHVEKEEIPEGAGEAAEASGRTRGLQEVFQEAPAPSLPRITATSLLQMREPAKVTAVEKASPAPSLAVEPASLPPSERHYRLQRPPSDWIRTAAPPSHKSPSRRFRGRPARPGGPAASGVRVPLPVRAAAWWGLRGDEVGGQQTGSSVFSQPEGRPPPGSRGSRASVRSLASAWPHFRVYSHFRVCAVVRANPGAAGPATGAHPGCSCAEHVLEKPLICFCRF